MDNKLIERYEFKAPSYELKDRSYPINPEFRENSRYYFDTDTGVYRSKAGDKQEISLLFSGDLLCQENMLARYNTEEGYDFSLCFEYIRPLLRSVDFAAGNLETPIAHTAPYRGEIITHEGPYYCNAPLKYLEALNYAGFDMLYTANNHTLDAGARGLMETIENSRQYGFIQTGTNACEGDKFVVADVCGIKVGFASFSVKYNDMDDNLTEEGKAVLLNTYSKELAKKCYDGMKALGAEYCVAFPHWGREYMDVIVKAQKQAAEEMVAMGYDLVTGCHAHIVQRATEIGGKPVLYGMGNLISHLNAKASIKELSALTVLYSLKLKREGNRILPSVGVIPCKILQNYKNIPFTVVPMTDIELPESLKNELDTGAELLREKLKCDALPLIKDYKISSKAKKEFALAQLAIPEKVKALLPEVKVKTSKQEKFIEQVSDRGSIYLIYEDHAELIHLTAPTGTFTFSPPEKVKDKPVTIYNSYSKGNDSLKLLYIPVTLEVIGPGMFRDFTALESFRRPKTAVGTKGLKVIGMGAFENCVSMTGIIMPDAVETIEDYAFRGCSKLISVKLSDNVKYIAPNAFEGCDKLTIYCNKGSYGEKFAKAQNIPVKYMGTVDPEGPNEKLPAEPEKIRYPEDYSDLVGKLRHFVGPAMVQPDLEEINAIRKTIPPVKFGPMNGPEERYPQPIIDTCKFLGHPLPEDAVCGNQPSHYLGLKAFDGKLATIDKLLGDRHPQIPVEEWAKLYRRFRFKYQKMDNLHRNATDFTVYFVDHVLNARPMGFNYDDYFDYELYNKEPEIRATFVDDEFRLKLYNSCVPKKLRLLFKNKPEFNAKYSEFVTRDWLDIMTCSFEEFEAFAAKHPRFFVKPIGLFGGHGAHIVDTAGENLEAVYQQLLTEEVIAEELLVQYDELAAFSSTALNTVRVLVYLDDSKEAHVLLGVARFGRQGNEVDNFHGGGVGAIIDVDTGIVISEAMNRSHFTSPIHPDSKLLITGFKYPKWDEIKEMAKKVALVTPEVRNLGLDFAVLKDGHIELIEGNSRSGFDILQGADQTGRKHLYAPFFEEIDRRLMNLELYGNLDGKKPEPKKPAKKPAKKKESKKKTPPKAPKFAGPAEVLENAAELDEIRKTLPPVKMGPKNGDSDPHPQPVLEACEALGHPLPADAVCGHQPSYYIGQVFDGRRTPIKKLLEGKIPEMTDEELKTSHKEFLRRYNNHGCIDRNGTDFSVYFADFLMHCRPNGVAESDYFHYEFYNKEQEVRDTFIVEEFRLRIYHTCTGKKVWKTFKYKPEFNKLFADFIHRDWLDTTKDCTFEDFKLFASKHEKFFAKQLGRCSGIGAHVIDRDSDTLENIWQHCQDEQLLLEEIIVQHDELAEFNPDTLNTLRVITMVDTKGVPHIVHGVARFGRKGKAVDNFHGGGMACIFDVETGTLISEGINSHHQLQPVHPDSGKPFVGFKYPKWDEIKETALRAAMVMPEIRHVGWDFCVKKDGTVEIVEGNSRSSGDLLQSPDQTGRKHLYEKYIDEIDAYNAAKAKEEAEAKAEAAAKRAAEKAAKAAQQSAASKKSQSKKAPAKKKSLLSRIKRKLRKLLD